MLRGIPPLETTLFTALLPQPPFLMRITLSNTTTGEKRRRFVLGPLEMDVVCTQDNFFGSTPNGEFHRDF